MRNSGQGVWKQVGRDSYTSRFLFERFDVNGLFIGVQEVERKMTLSSDGDSLSMTGFGPSSPRTAFAIPELFRIPS